MKARVNLRKAAPSVHKVHEALLTGAVAAINFWNRLNVSLRTEAETYQPSDQPHISGRRGS